MNALPKTGLNAPTKKVDGMLLVPDVFRMAFRHFDECIAQIVQAFNATNSENSNC